MIQDLRYGWRMLRVRSAFTLAAVFSLALGIGANTAIFSFLDAALLKSLPYHDSERLVDLHELNSDDGSFSIPWTKSFLAWRERNRVFSNIAAVTTRDGRLNLTGRGPASIISAEFVSSNYFDLLGLGTAIGRSFVEGEDQRGAARVVVLSNRFWQRRFVSDPDVAGAGITLNNERYTIIGVLPAMGTLDRSGIDVWLPLVFSDEDIRNNRAFFNAVARLKPGVTIEQAAADLRAISATADTRGGYGAMVRPLGATLVSADTRKLLLLLMGAVFFVLLIACANVANLLLARGAARQREMVMRAALGASRLRLLRQMLTESMLLAAISGAAGALLAVWMVNSSAAIWPRSMLPTETEVTVDWRVLIFALIVSFLAGGLFGIVPAWRAASFNLAAKMRERGAGVSARWKRNKARSLLLVTQIALTFVLLVGASLLIRSLTLLTSVDPGFEPEHVLMLQTNLDQARYPQSHQLLAYQSELLSRMRASPAVEFAAAADETPFGGTYSMTVVYLAGREPQDTARRKSVGVCGVTADYFRALGVRLIRGRLISDQDIRQSTPVAVISESLAREYGADREPLGEKLRFAGDTLPQPTIVGVVADARFEGLGRPAGHLVYLAFAQYSDKQMTIRGRSMFFIARARGEPKGLASVLAALAGDLDQDQPVYSITTMDDSIAATLKRPRFHTLLFTLFGGLAFVLATIGIYGVASYATAQQTREIGIRMALGARASDVLKLVMKQGLGLALTGALIGLSASLVLTRYLASLLYEVRPTDPTTLACVALLLIGVGLFACYVPARRATKVDPMVALRDE